MIVTKDLLVRKMTDINGLTQKDNKEALDTLTTLIPDILANGDKVTLCGFGSFDVIERQAREGYNPATGERIHIDSKKAPRFKAGKPFKETIANS